MEKPFAYLENGPSITNLTYRRWPMFRLGFRRNVNITFWLIPTLINFLEISDPRNS